MQDIITDDTEEQKDSTKKLVSNVSEAYAQEGAKMI